MMNQISLDVYEERVRPSLTKREATVYWYARTKGRFTLESIAALMNVPTHTISGRLTALKKKGLIRAVGRTTNKASNPCTFYEVNR